MVAHLCDAGDRFIPAGAGNTSGSTSWEYSVSVHPRGRGEHVDRSKSGALVYGSSPRARGTRSTTIFSQIRRAVHPRGRGEHQPVISVDEIQHGSSPRARGTPCVGFDSAADWRFIPAGAGNTSRGYDRQKSGAVHPRGRGEHRLDDSKIDLDQRFIPAGAGNTGTRCQSGTGCSVHPRGRGEHYGHRWTSAIDGGSSPRARGTRHQLNPPHHHNRFIPAGAGNTIAPALTFDMSSVHPRGRGEHS